MVTALIIRIGGLGRGYTILREDEDIKTDIVTESRGPCNSKREGGLGFMRVQGSGFRVYEGSGFRDPIP